MILKDNLGDTNSIENSMKQAVSVLSGPQNCQMGQRARRSSMIKSKEQGLPRWRSGLAPPAAWGVILGTRDRVPHQAPCMEPAFSLCLCLCPSLSVSMNK